MWGLIGSIYHISDCSKTEQEEFECYLENSMGSYLKSAEEYRNKRHPHLYWNFLPPFLLNFSMIISNISNTSLIFKRTNGVKLWQRGVTR